MVNTPELKIAVLHFSGNVGKTMFAKNILVPRLDDPIYIPVETINTGSDADDEKLRGDEFGLIWERVFNADCAVVDVGASNVESFIEHMRLNRGSQDVFDFFVVPCTPKLKQQMDTLATIKFLSDLGVAPEKVLVVFNQVDAYMTAETAFGQILDKAASDGSFTPIVDLMVRETELFKLLAEHETTMSDVLADTRDWNILKKSYLKGSFEREQVGAAARIHMLAKSLSQDYDALFNRMFGVAA